MHHVVTVDVSADEARHRLLALDQQWRQSELPPEFRKHWTHRVRVRELGEGSLRVRFEPQGSGPYVEAVLRPTPPAEVAGCRILIHTRETPASFWFALAAFLLGPAILTFATRSPWYTAAVGSLWLGLGWRVAVRLRIVQQDVLLEATLTHLFGEVRLRSAA